MGKKAIILAALIVIAMMNVVSFRLMGCDKRRARHGKRRIPEKRLFPVTVCFGGPGGVTGLKVFHHKTQHRYFGVIDPALLIFRSPSWQSLSVDAIRLMGKKPKSRMRSLI